MCFLPTGPWTQRVAAAGISQEPLGTHAPVSSTAILLAVESRLVSAVGARCRVTTLEC